MSMTLAATDKIALYEAMVQKDPDNTLIQLNLYDLHHQAGNFEEAAAGFMALLADEQYGRTARSNLAKVRLSQSEFEDAEWLFNELVEAGETDPALFHNQ